MTRVAVSDDSTNTTTRDPNDPFIYRPTRDKRPAGYSNRTRLNTTLHQQHAVPSVGPSEQGTLLWSLTISNPYPFSISLTNVQLHVATITKGSSRFVSENPIHQHSQNGECWGRIVGPVTLDARAQTSLIIPVNVTHINTDTTLIPHVLRYSALHLTFAQSLRLSQQHSHPSGRVDLIAPLPTLRVTTFPPLSHTSNSQLFEGECSSVGVTLTNVGPGCLDILDLDMQMESSTLPPSPQSGPPSSVSLRVKSKLHTRHASLHTVEDYSSQTIETPQSHPNSSPPPLHNVIDISKLHHSLTSTLPWSPHGNPLRISVPVVARSFW